MQSHYNVTLSLPGAASVSRKMKVVVVVAFILILGSLASALLFLMKDKGKSNRTVTALAFRVGFSIALFLLILAMHYFGYIEPTGFMR